MLKKAFSNRLKASLEINVNAIKSVKIIPAAFQMLCVVKHYVAKDVLVSFFFINILKDGPIILINICILSANHYLINQK